MYQVQSNNYIILMQESATACANVKREESVSPVPSQQLKLELHKDDSDVLSQSATQQHNSSPFDSEGHEVAYQ